MSPVNYIILILLCLPVLIAIDLNRLKLALIFWTLLLVPFVIVTFLPQWRSLADLKWVIWLAQFYWLKKHL